MQTKLDWLRQHKNYLGNDCLIWPFSYARGYGNLGFDGQITYAHRVMCKLAHGEPPSPTHHAAHTCGNSRCVNPGHIEWKTPSANQLDKRIHGGLNRRGRRKLLTRDQAMAIRKDTTSTHDELAKKYGTCRRNIGAIKDGRSWS